MRQRLVRYFSQNPPDLFIGVDAAEFNLSLEGALKRKGILTAHYVSPSVWAWRQKRVFRIKKSVDLMLCLFPFEEAFYQAYEVPVCCTGHPFADQIALEIDIKRAKKILKAPQEKQIVAVLPGSRDGELKHLSEIYIETMRWCVRHRDDLLFYVPFTCERHKSYFEEQLRKSAPDLIPQTHLLMGESRAVMAAADVVLVTSGTATLEVMLHKKPMVIGYKTHPVTYHLVKRLLKVPYIGLPNLLANAPLVPELIQGELKPERAGALILAFLSRADKNADEASMERKKALESKFLSLHQGLRRHASETAAHAIAGLWEQRTAQVRARNYDHS